MAIEAGELAEGAEERRATRAAARSGGGSGPDLGVTSARFGGTPERHVVTACMLWTGLMVFINRGALAAVKGWIDSKVRS